MAIMLNARSNVYENIFFSASQPPDSSTISQIAGIADSLIAPNGERLHLASNSLNYWEIFVNFGWSVPEHRHLAHHFAIASSR